jgi:hypothetical protein
LVDGAGGKGFPVAHPGATAIQNQNNPSKAKPMKAKATPICSLTAALVSAALTLTSARADSFGSGGNAFTIDFVTIGNPGNANDAAFDNTFPGYSSPYGGVGYEYRMGKYEISEDMIAKANTLGGLLITKDTRGVNQPATSVSWNEAARFVNWLNVSSGYAPAYNFAVQPGGGGYTGNENLMLWISGDAGYDASNPYRNSNARYVLPSEHEWYKAAYYSGSGTTYFDYPTGSDTIPTAVASGTASGTAVYNGQPGPADIIQAGGLSHYGTMGQGGNVLEWHESAHDGINNSSSEKRALRGGNWSNSEIDLRSSFHANASPSASNSSIGFRVASVPEPSSTVLMISAGLLALARRRRRAAL